MRLGVEREKEKKARKRTKFLSDRQQALLLDIFVLVLPLFEAEVSSAVAV